MLGCLLFSLHLSLTASPRPVPPPPPSPRNTHLMVWTCSPNKRTGTGAHIWVVPPSWQLLF